MLKILAIYFIRRTVRHGTRFGKASQIYAHPLAGAPGGMVLHSENHQ